MISLKKLFDNNREWAENLLKTDPDYFKNLSEQQSPEYLWIGCSDSRVPANQIVGLSPGELFVHRNVANVVIQTDFNCLSVIEYAVEVLNVKHIIVCGHYGCGGVLGALRNTQLGLIDNWLRHIREVWKKHGKELAQIKGESEKLSRLCELNVIEQANNVCSTTILQDAWNQGKKIHVHGWIYDISDGLLNDLNVSSGSNEDMKNIFGNPLI